MADTKHTPGKWTAHDRWVNQPGRPIYAGNKKKNIVAWVNYDRPDDPDWVEAKANAELIARAPALLDENTALWNKIEEHTKSKNKTLDRIDRARDYLMQVQSKDLTVEGVLEALGFTRDGLNQIE